MKITYPLLLIVMSGGWRTTMPVHLCYDSAYDPHAVALKILTPGRIITWLCGRELLRDGLTRIAGDGDIRITPGPMSIGVHLSSPQGNALLVFARDDLTQFLRTVFLEVPQGAERIDWDREMELLA